MLKSRHLEQPIRPRHPLWPLVAAFALLAVALPALSAETSEEIAALIMQAEEALQDSDYGAAADAYRDAALLSDDPEVAEQATRIAYSYGFNKTGLESAERWLKLQPDNDEAVLYVALLDLRTGHIRDSRKAFEKLLEEGEPPADDRLLALIPFLAREDEQNAYELMRQLARPYKDSPEAHYAVAVMALQAGDTETAGERAQEAIELEPDWIKPHLLYARSMLLAGDEEGAIDYTSRLVGDSPHPDPEARLELAIMLISAERDEDALSQVNQILLEQPARSDALRLMAIINFRLDYMDAAKADFQDLLESGYFTMDALYYLGRIADRREEFDEALHYYTQVNRGDNAVVSQRRVAGIMAQDGETEEALEYLDEFAAENPTYAVDMLQAKAQLLYTAERYDDALAYYDKVVEYRPDDEGLHLGRAELLLRMERLDDALDQYALAVRRWPDSSMSLNAYGYTLADRTDRYRDARKLIRKALDINPDSAAIIDSWGWVLFKLGEYEESLKQLQTAYEKLHDPEVAGHIFAVLMALDREEEALAGLAEAELLFPDSQFLKDVRERYLKDAH